LRHAFLAGVIALSTSVATANTDVTFAGNYTNASGDTVNVADATGDVGYQYVNSNGDTVSVANQSTDPDLTDFTYTDVDGTPANLSTGLHEITYFAGTSAASGDITTTQEIVAGANVERDNYSYVNGAGETVTLGDVAQNMIQNITLNAEYASGTEVSVTNGIADTVVDGTMYIAVVDGQSYHLSADGTELYRSDNTPVGVPEPDSALEAAFNAMQGAYTGDTAAILAAETLTADQWADEQTNFGLADGVFNTDSTTVDTLTGYWQTYETAADLLTDAQNAQQDAVSTYNNNDGARNDALAVYDAPITTTITDGANDAIAASIADGDIKNALDTTEQAAQEYADDKVAAEKTARESADQELQDAIEAEIERAQGAEGTIRGEFASADEQTLAGAKEYTDDKVAAEESARESADRDLQDAIEAEAGRATAAENALRNEFTSANAETLARANAYTDKKVDTLEKNVSGGVAAATALSAVSVSNVKRGEVSVGGGYGYYNDQSAVALGATMGLSDNWSVNAGAGVATGDKTQFAIRAGTNYKFKLF